MRMCHFWDQDDPFVLNIFFLVQTILLLSSTYWPFSLCKILKILTADPELWGWAIFGPKMVHLPQTVFFWKIINITLIYLLAPFIVQNFKKILPADPELWGCAIFGPKMTHFPEWEIFRKPVNEPCFFQSCLSTCQKSKSDVNLLVKYWWLKNTEFSLVESHFWL